MSRADRQLAEPGRDLTDFPRTDLPVGQTLYRSHSAANKPWWFASIQPEPSDGGRLDLAAPRGTCYVALDPGTAARERFGEQLRELGYVSAEAVDAAAISMLELQEDVSAADGTDRLAANFVLTRELAALDDYPLAQSWAAAFDGAGFDALMYQSRFTSGKTEFAVALFGDAGARSWPVAGEEDVNQILAEAGIKVVRPVPLRTVLKSDRLEP